MRQRTHFNWKRSLFFLQFSVLMCNSQKFITKQVTKRKTSYFSICQRRKKKTNKQTILNLDCTSFPRKLFNSSTQWRVVWFDLKLHIISFTISSYVFRHTHTLTHNIVVHSLLQLLQFIRIVFGIAVKTVVFFIRFWCGCFFIFVLCIYHLCLWQKFQQFLLFGLDLIVFNSIFRFACSHIFVGFSLEKVRFWS